LVIVFNDQAEASGADWLAQKALAIGLAVEALRSLLA
jgi:hypothetical protein